MSVVPVPGSVGLRGSAVWTALEAYVGPIANLLLIPIWVRHLGVTDYGRFIVLSIVMGLGGIGGGGFAGATLKAIAATDLADSRSASRIVRASLGIVSILSASLCVGIWICAPSIAGSIFARLGDWDETTGLIRQAGILLVVIQLDQVFVSALRGRFAFRASALCECAGKLALVSASMVMFSFVSDAQGLGSVVCCSATVALSTRMLCVSRIFGVKSLLPMYSPEVSYSLFSYGKWIWIQSLAAISFTYGDRALAGAIFGAATLGIYNIVLQVTQQIHVLQAATFAVVLPNVARMGTDGDIERLKIFVGKQWRLNVTLSVVCAAALALFPTQILGLITGRAATATESEFFVLMCIAFGILASGVVPYYVFLGMGQPKRVALTNAFAGILMLTVLVSCQHLGAFRSLAFARMSYALTTVYLSWRLYHLMHRRGPAAWV